MIPFSWCINQGVSNLMWKSNQKFYITVVNIGLEPMIITIGVKYIFK